MGSHALVRPGPKRQRVATRLRAAAARADSLAVELAGRPGRALALVLVVDLVLAAGFVAIGLGLLGDQAELFRELTPGTFVSFAQLLFIAAIAWAAHRRAEGSRRWWMSFWGLSAAFFLLFAFDEITQSAMFLAQALEDWFAARPTSGFHDVEAVLLTLLFATTALVLLPRALVLLRHPRALVLLGIAVALGAASQSLDSFAPATRWEFVAEETLKLATEAFFIGGFLVALRDVLARSARPSAPAASAPRPA
jgi:hypothetical protein